MQDNKKNLLYLSLGLTTTISQVIILREFMIVFFGNELTIGFILAFWLFWTAAGSLLANKILFQRIDSEKLISPLLFVVSVVAPLTILLIRMSKGLFVAVSGEMMGLFSIIISSIVILAPLCFMLGSLFTTASLSQRKNYAESTSVVYKYESIGSAFGGLFLSLILLEQLDSFQIIFLVSVLNVFIGFIFLKINLIHKNLILFFVLGMIMLLSALWFGNEINHYTLQKLWSGFNIIDSRESKYGNLTIIEVNEEKSVYENGIKIASTEETEKNEESVHYALLAHENPQSLLLAGGGISGSITEILKHPTIKQIDYIEIDPEIFEVGKTHFKNIWNTIEKDSRVHFYKQDGRLFIKKTEQKYDVIIVNAGDPLNANINRFYTIEFFEEVKNRLKSGGIYTFQLTGSENYLNNELIELLQVINKTLSAVFAEVKILPGDNIHFFASAEKYSFEIETDRIIDRIKQRGIENRFVNENYLYFKLMPERIEKLAGELNPATGTRINEDFRPVAYFLNVIFWNTQSGASFGNWFKTIKDLSLGYILIFIIIFFVILILLVFKYKESQKIIAGAAIFFMGFSLMTFQLQILLGFQSKMGHVYQQLALLIGIFMAGMGFGSGIAIKYISAGKQNLYKELIIVYTFSALMPLIIILILSNMFFVEMYLGEFITIWFIFPLLAIITGGIGGYQFPVVSKLYFGNSNSDNRNIGLLYGLDILGAMAGTIILTLLFIPLFGFYNVALFALLLNLFVIIALVRVSKN